MSINQKEIMKTAAAQLRLLSEERDSLLEQQEKFELVKDILTKTASYESVEDVFEKMASYLEKEKDELIVIKKAIELHKTGQLSLGIVSSQKLDLEELDPLTSMLIDG
jgi:predicted rRNA methylase YqxC with S4 and FtsJ domains